MKYDRYSTALQLKVKELREMIENEEYEIDFIEKVMAQLKEDLLDNGYEIEVEETNFSLSSDCDLVLLSGIKENEDDTFKQVSYYRDGKIELTDFQYDGEKDYKTNDFTYLDNNEDIVYLHLF